MNREQTKKILHLINVNYPNAYARMTDADKEELITLWEMSFSKSDPNAVMQAVMQWISTDTKGFPPVIGQIKEIMMQSVKLPHIDAEEAWLICVKNAKCNEATSSDNYKELPMTIQDALGGYGKLVQLAWSDNDSAKWLKKDFIARYQAIQEDEATGIQSGRYSLPYVELRNREPKQKILEIGKGTEPLLITRGEIDRRLLELPAERQRSAELMQQILTRGKNE